MFSQEFAYVWVVFSGAGSWSSPGCAPGGVSCSPAQLSPGSGSAGAGCGGSLVPAVLGKLPVTQHGITDKSRHPAQVTCAILWLQVHEGPCSLCVTVVCSAIPVSHRAWHTES